MGQGGGREQTEARAQGKREGRMGRKERGEREKSLQNPAEGLAVANARGGRGQSDPLSWGEQQENT